MTTSKPTSILIFLAACLAFTEALVGVAGAIDKEISGLWLLGFGTLDLILILGTLLYMFQKRPEFLIAERKDVVPLRVIEAVLQHNDPRLVKELIRKLDLKVLTEDPRELPSVDRSEAIVTEEQRGKLAAEQAKLKQEFATKR